MGPVQSNKKDINFTPETQNIPTNNVNNSNNTKNTGKLISIKPKFILIY